MIAPRTTITDSYWFLGLLTTTQNNKEQRQSKLFMAFEQTSIELYLYAVL